MLIRYPSGFAMKWLYLILAIALLPLGLFQAVGVIGYFCGWWDSDAATIRESAAWAIALIGLSVGGFVRWWYLRRPVRARGFPVSVAGGKTEG